MNQYLRVSISSLDPVFEYWDVPMLWVSGVADVRGPALRHVQCIHKDYEWIPWLDSLGERSLG